jgi:hypothetical protein
MNENALSGNEVSFFDEKPYFIPESSKKSQKDSSNPEKEFNS